LTNESQIILVALIGDGIGASRSPALHEGEGKAQGLRYYYELVDMADRRMRGATLEETLKALEEREFTGCQITHPYKQQIIPLLHELSPEAQVLGAVNSVLFKDGRRIGHNLDWWGFAEGLKQNIPDAAIGAIAVLGCGGAGSATAYAMLRLGATHIKLHDLDPARSRALADRLSPHFPLARIEPVSTPQALLDGVDGLVQATEVGMVGHEGLPIDPGLLSRSMWVADVIYTPPETPLIQAAKALGCRTTTGRGMVVNQVVVAFELFTGRRGDVKRIETFF